MIKGISNITQVFFLFYFALVGEIKSIYLFIYYSQTTVPIAPHRVQLEPNYTAHRTQLLAYLEWFRNS